MSAALHQGDAIYVVAGDHQGCRGVYERSEGNGNVIVTLDHNNVEVVIERAHISPGDGNVLVPREAIFQLLDDMEEIRYQLNDLKAMVLELARQQN